MSSVEEGISEGLDSLRKILAELEVESRELGPGALRQAAILALGRRANARPSLAVLMEDTVALAVASLEADLGGVSEAVDHGTALVLRIAEPGKHRDSLSPLVERLSTDPAVSMAGYALSAADTVVSSDLAAEDRFRDLALRKLGVVSAITVPLHLNNEPFGALGIYATGKREFAPEEVAFAETVANLLATSIGRVNAEEELQKQRTLASRVMEAVDALVLMLDVKGNILNMNRACRQATSFSIEEVRNKPFCSVLMVPEDVELVQGIFRNAKNDKSECRFEGFLLAKNGNRKRVSWSQEVVCDAEGQIQSIMLTGIDRTEQAEMEAELQYTKALAEEAVKMLEGMHCEAEGKDQPGEGGTAHGGKSETDQPSAAQDRLSRAVPITDQGRRSSPRGQYRYYQMVARFFRGLIPARKSFFKVECNDISAGGFSFVLDEPPDFDSLIVALGVAPDLTHVAAEVKHVTQCELNGRRAYLVGCQFVGRIRVLD